MEKTVASFLNEIRARIELLESSLPRGVDPMAVSPISKLPYKALLYREALIWRMTELCREALEGFEKNKLLSAIVLTRATAETSAALWYLWAKIDAVVKSGDVQDIDKDLVQLCINDATDPLATNRALPKPVRIAAFRKQVDKDIEGFSRQYGILCEYAHPNWAGTVLLYSKPNPGDQCTIFGQNIRGDSTKKIGVANLNAALMMFEKSYTRIGDLMPTFIALCENKLKTKDAAGTV
jgi:hypothetical protein